MHKSFNELLFGWGKRALRWWGGGGLWNMRPAFEKRGKGRDSSVLSQFRLSVYFSWLAFYLPSVGYPDSITFSHKFFSFNCLFLLLTFVEYFSVKFSFPWFVGSVVLELQLQLQILNSTHLQFLVFAVLTLVTTPSTTPETKTLQAQKR